MQAIGRITPPTLDEVVRYLYGVPLRCDPGTKSSDVDQGYSNGAFHVLTALLQQVTRSSLDDFIRRRLLAPLSLADLFIASTRPGAPVPGEVIGYDAAGSSPSQLDLSENALAADAYGGTVLTEVAPGTGGLATSVITVARFIGNHAVWDLGGRNPGSTRYGDFEGTSTAAHSRPDGLDIAFAFNFWVPDADKDRLLAELNNVLDIYAFEL